MLKVSVIIPAYNAMVYLPETMKSVLKQTYDDFEVIVVNDGSSDQTEQWVSQITDPRVRLICQRNQGSSAARNTGINQARGEYIAFLDADDLWEPTKLEKQVHCLEQDPEAGLVYTWTALIDEKGESRGKVIANYAEGNVWKTLIECNILECGSTPMIRRCCFESVGVFDINLGSLCDDWEMWIRIASRYSFKVVKEPLVYYRAHSNSTSKNWELMEQAYSKTIEKVFSSAQSDLLYLKSRSYGYANLCLAWKPLQSQENSYKKAIHFCQQALKHYPQLRFSREYVRLNVAIAMMRWLGPYGYRRVIALIYALRRTFQTLHNKTFSLNMQTEKLI